MEGLEGANKYFSQVGIHSKYLGYCTLAKEKESFRAESERSIRLAIKTKTSSQCL